MPMPPLAYYLLSSLVILPHRLGYAGDDTCFCFAVAGKPPEQPVLRWLFIVDR